MRELVKIMPSKKWSVLPTCQYFLTLAGTFLWVLRHPSLQHFATVCCVESRAVASQNFSSLEVVIGKLSTME